MTNETNAPSNQNPKPERILLIGESDCTGTGGIQGGIKTVQALGGFAMSATTAVTLHDAETVLSIKNITPSFVDDQIRAILKSTRNIDAIKIGFLQNVETINIVAQILEEIKDRQLPVIVDPCLVSRTGDLLMDSEAIAALKREIYIHTTVLTPNIDEAHALGVMQIEDVDDMYNAADMMRTLGVENIVLKGGKMDNERELYFVATPDDERIYERPTIDTPHTLGAGCALSAALALNIVRYDNIFEAVEYALSFLQGAIANSRGFGFDVGPINHGFDIQQNLPELPKADIKIYKRS